MRTAHPLILLLCGLAATAPPATAQPRAADRPDRQAAAPKETTIGVVISALRKEARAHWQQHRQWPRSASTFADEKNWTVPADQLRRGLRRRLDQNPAIDGYIKHQLLGFEVGLPDAKTDAIQRIVAHAPEPIARPEPDLQQQRGRRGGVSMTFGRQINFISDIDPVVGPGAVAFDPKVRTFTSGTSFGANRRPEQRTLHSIQQSVTRANRKLNEAARSTEIANRPILAYREALTDRLPSEGGLRMAVLIKDIRARLEAGHPSAEDRLRHAVELSEKLRATRALPRDRAAKLAGWAERLGRMETPIVRAVRFNRDDGIRYDRRHLVLPTEATKKLAGNLRRAAQRRPR